ncbi:MAG TPA: S49 family peptidase [Thermoanaerobaculia bacterium]|nr:S49 family peptidase [Thermoanaerobaculia bacterium]
MSKEEDEGVEHRPAERVLAKIRSEHWAITDSGMALVESIALRENVVTKEALERIEVHKEAVAAKRAARMDGTEGVTKREGGVAILEVSGPIFPEANLFTQISGATAIEDLSLDFNAALSDRSISSILMIFRTPGGNIVGVNEFVNMVYAARGTKPIVAYVPEMACSAGYWIASACDEIVLDATAEVGSIGMIGRGGKERQNESVVTVKSKRAGKKNLDPGSEAGKAALKATVDYAEGVMVASIARNRSMTEEAVTAEEGGILMGQAAVDGGLADHLGSFEGLISELGGASSGAQPGRYALNEQKEKKAMANVKTAEERIAELEALNASQKARLEAADRVSATALEAQVGAEVVAFVTPLKLAGEGGDLRFNAKELTSIEGMLKRAKLASVGIIAGSDGVPQVLADSAPLKALGAFFVTELTAYVAAKSPAAPSSELPKGAETGAGATPSIAVFNSALMGDREAVKVVSAYVDTLYAADSTKPKEDHRKAAMAAAELAAAKK